MDSGDAAAQAWARAERLLRLGHWHWTLATDTVTWSPGLHRLLDAERPAPPPFGSFAACWTPDSRVALDDAMAVARSAGQPHALLLEARRGALRPAWFQARADALRDADGAVTALHGTLQDVTRERTLEELRTQRAIAEAAADGRARFVARLSGALRSPLNVVLGLAQTLRQAPGSAPPGQLDMLAAAGAQMHGTLDQLGSLADAGLGRTKLQRVAVDVVPLVRACADVLRPRAADGGVTLHDHGSEGDVGLVVGDPTAVRRVVVEVLEAGLLAAGCGGALHVVVRPLLDRVELLVTAVVAAPPPAACDGFGPEVARAWLALMHGELVERNAADGGRVWSARFDLAT